MKEEIKEIFNGIFSLNKLSINLLCGGGFCFYFHFIFIETNPEYKSILNFLSFTMGFIYGNSLYKEGYKLTHSKLIYRSSIILILTLLFYLFSV